MPGAHRRFLLAAACGFGILLVLPAAGTAQALPADNDSQAPPVESQGPRFGKTDHEHGPHFAPPIRGWTHADVKDWLGRPPVEKEPKRWHREKNPRLAMLCSFLVPGLGQLYNEREFWALVAAGVHFFYIGDIIVQRRLETQFRQRAETDPEDTESQVLWLLHRDNRIQSTWLLGLTILISGLQAFVDAHLFDFESMAPLRFEADQARFPAGVLRWRY